MAWADPRSSKGGGSPFVLCLLGVGLTRHDNRRPVGLGCFKNMGFPLLTRRLRRKRFGVDLVMVPHDEHGCDENPHRGPLVKGQKGPTQERAITPRTHAMGASRI